MLDCIERVHGVAMDYDPLLIELPVHRSCGRVRRCFRSSSGAYPETIALAMLPPAKLHHGAPSRLQRQRQLLTVAGTLPIRYFFSSIRWRRQMPSSRRQSRSSNASQARSQLLDQMAGSIFHDHWRTGTSMPKHNPNR